MPLPENPIHTPVRGVPGVWSIPLFSRLLALGSLSTPLSIVFMISLIAGLVVVTFRIHRMLNLSSARPFLAMTTHPPPMTQSQSMVKKRLTFTVTRTVKPALAVKRPALRYVETPAQGRDDRRDATPSLPVLEWGQSSIRVRPTPDDRTVNRT